jgi:hypothetical protein
MRFSIKAKLFERELSYLDLRSVVTLHDRKIEIVKYMREYDRVTKLYKSDGFSIASFIIGTSQNRVSPAITVFPKVYIITSHVFDDSIPAPQISHLGLQRARAELLLLVVSLLLILISLA